MSDVTRPERQTATPASTSERSFWSRHRTLKWIVTALAGAVFVLAFVLDDCVDCHRYGGALGAGGLAR